jgi:hypothetical protein
LSISALDPGTLVEVVRTRLVSEVMVIESVIGPAVVLRKATYYERWRFWWRSRRQTANEISAAAESNIVIERAKSATKEST